MFEVQKSCEKPDVLILHAFVFAVDELTNIPRSSFKEQISKELQGQGVSFQFVKITLLEDDFLKDADLVGLILAGELADHLSNVR